MSTLKFFIRKALSFGPFRLNLSKSGVGESFGVKGLRVGVKPSGRTYVQGGREGLYFRQTLSEPAATPVAAPPTAGPTFSYPRHPGDDPLLDEAFQAVEQNGAVFTTKADALAFITRRFRLEHFRASALVDRMIEAAQESTPNPPAPAAGTPDSSIGPELSARVTALAFDSVRNSRLPEIAKAALDELHKISAGLPIEKRATLQAMVQNIRQKAPGLRAQFEALVANLRSGSDESRASIVRIIFGLQDEKTAAAWTPQEIELAPRFRALSAGERVEVLDALRS